MAFTLWLCSCWATASQCLGTQRSCGQAFPAHHRAPRTGSCVLGGRISPGKPISESRCSLKPFLPRPPSSSPFTGVRHGLKALSSPLSSPFTLRGHFPNLPLACLISIWHLLPRGRLKKIQSNFT